MRLLQLSQRSLILNKQVTILKFSLMRSHSNHQNKT